MVVPVHPPADGNLSVCPLDSVYCDIEFLEVCMYGCMYVCMYVWLWLVEESPKGLVWVASHLVGPGAPLAATDIIAAIEDPFSGTLHCSVLNVIIPEPHDLLEEGLLHVVGDDDSSVDSLV